MSISGFQEFWLTGSRFYFQREEDTSESLLDLGVIEVVSPTLEPESIELEDSDGGVRRIVDTAVTKISETYEIVCKNFNVDNLAMLFLADVNSPALFTQAITPLVDVEHIACVGNGKYVKLKDADGNWLYSINSITIERQDPTTTTATPVPVTVDVDWEWTSKDRGIIKVIEGGSINDGDRLLISITPNAISGRRLIYPQTGAILKGKAMLVWGRGNNASQTVREATVSIAPSAASFSVEDYSSFTLQASVLSDIIETVAPAGRLLQFKGTQPSA
jgi:hypothetical protein